MVRSRGVNVIGPLDHGILDFVHTELASGVKEPITSDERRVPAIWNMASWGGRKVAVFGLWATYPAEDKSRCVQTELYLPSYVEWITCLEMERDARKMRQQEQSRR